MNRVVKKALRFHLCVTLGAMSAIAAMAAVAVCACPGLVRAADVPEASVRSTVPLVSPNVSAIDLLRDREIASEVAPDIASDIDRTIDRERVEGKTGATGPFFGPGPATPSSGVLHPTTVLTVLADSGLPAVFFEQLAEEVLMLKNLPVRIFFKGLPMTKRPDGRLTADRTAIAERLSPLLKKGIPSAVDPRVFRETESAVTAFEARLADTDRLLPQGFSAPGILVSVTNPETARTRHELVMGTLSPLRALAEAGLRSPSRLMRRDLRDGLTALGLAGVTDTGGDRPDRRLKHRSERETSFEESPR